MLNYALSDKMFNDHVILVPYVGLITNQRFNPYQENYLDRPDPTKSKQWNPAAVKK